MARQTCPLGQWACTALHNWVAMDG
jgi:hypothetical protein